jgi:hypothetical protein
VATHSDFYHFQLYKNCLTLLTTSLAVLSRSVLAMLGVLLFVNINKVVVLALIFTIIFFLKYVSIS